MLPQMGEVGLWNASIQACAADWNPTNNPPHVGYATVVRTYICPDDDARLSSPLGDEQSSPAAFTSYIGLAGIAGLEGYYPPRLGPFGSAPGIRLTDVVDGTSRTIAIGERPPPSSLQAGRWYPAVLYVAIGNGPDEYLRFPELNDYDAGCPHSGFPSLGPGRIDNPCDRFHLWSFHPGGANFLFCDGSARFLSYSANSMIPALSTIAGGEEVSIPD
jgi:prepilin-type processing-associated H-X9-DG protein